MEEVDVVDSTKSNILRYGAATFVRAFPDWRDGLKPVHRRILYTMFDNHVYSLTKVNNIVGKVMPIHPHGDSSTYGALVIMAQPWATNYPYIYGVGNFGTQNGDTAAAGRYIECQVSQFTKDVIFADLDEVSVNFTDNFDHKCRVPEYLPSRIPLVLINGGQGMGEGFRTCVPPHNLNEVADRCIMYIKNKNISNAELVDGLFPDFPTGGEITNGEEVAQMYKNNTTGVIKLRGKVKLDVDNSTIYFTEFPYGKDTDDIINAIRDAKTNGNMIMSGILQLFDINNNSDDDVNINKNKKNEPTVYKCICRKDVNLMEIVNEIYRTTSFADSISFSVIIDENGYPNYWSIKDIIQSWYKYRVDNIYRHHRNIIASCNVEKEKLEGLLSIYDRKNELIKIIDTHTGNREELILKVRNAFKFTLIQARAVTEMSIAQLAKFGKDKLIADIAALENKIRTSDEVLLNVDKVIIEQLEELKVKYGRPRRTTVIMSIEEHDSKIPVVSKGGLLCANNAIGLFDVNGLRDGKTILNGLKPLKVDGKNIRGINSGVGLHGTPKSFIVCYEKGCQRIESSVFKILNVWYDLGVDSFENRALCATPVYSDDDDLIAITYSNKLKRFKASEITGKRILNCGEPIKDIITVPSSNFNAILIVDKNGTYNLTYIDEVPLQSRNASGVKSAFEETTSKERDKFLAIVNTDETEGDTYRAMVAVVDTATEQNYMYTIPVIDMHNTSRTAKPKLLGLPVNYQVTSVDVYNIGNKDDQVTMIGKSNSSTLSVTNFKKPFDYKKQYMTIVMSGITT